MTAAPQIVPQPTARLYELVTFQAAAQDGLPTQWPRGPGRALRAADGTPEILKIAADRWLMIEPCNEWVAAAAALADRCALTEVTGKWREFRLSGPSAGRLLANTVNVEELLAGRDCARSSLFDCPALLYAIQGGFSVWIERSYAGAFVLAAEVATRAIRAQAGLT